jgi:murein DD-endopeptidase MepM/ murein hydrolase activator NlpD
MRNCVPKSNYTQPLLKQEFPSSMRRERPAEVHKRHLFASIGLAVVFAASTLLGLAVHEVAEGASAVAAPEPFSGEPPMEPVGISPEEDAAQLVESLAAEPEPPAEPTVITEGELARGDTLAAALRRSNVPQGVIHFVATEMSKVFDFRRAQPGHSFRLTQDLQGRVQDFRYRTTPTESVHLAFEDGEYVVRREQAELMPRVSRIAGVVTSSLYGAMDVDFSHTVQRGDEFRVLYERLYYADEDGSETYAGPGRILAARYGGPVGEHTAVYFESEESRGGYFRPDGSSMERQFLLAPLRYSRISSRFTSARRHPILKITRPHHGIDYVAKAGSPVWAVADGEVIYRGWAGGFGNLLKIRHVKGYVSYYTHLSRFAAGLRLGDRVQQKQVIAYVGQTGLATGPHVCFRITQNGRYVNPASLRSPPAKPVSDAARDIFIATRDTLLSELDAGPFIASGEAL